MKKRYELTAITDLRYSFIEERYGFYYTLRDMETGYNFEAQFIPFHNKRKLIDLLRASGVYCPHKVYRAIG